MSQAFDEHDHPRDLAGKFASKPDAAEQDDRLIAGISTDPFLAPIAYTPPQHLGSGRWEVDNATSREAEPRDTPDGRINRTVIGIGGFPETRARNRAAAAIYRDLAWDTDYDDTDAPGLHDLASQHEKVTLLVAQRSGQVEAREGTLFLTDDERIALLPKGKRRDGHLIDPTAVIDYGRGYGHAEALAQTWHRRKAQYTPQLEPITSFDDVPVDEDDTDRSKIRAVYMVDQPNFDDGYTAGCLFFATDQQPGDGPHGDTIVNGYFWAPDDFGGLESEHGSFYGQDLRNRGGKLVDFEPGSMTFSDCWKDMPESRMEGYRRVLGHDWVRA